MTESAFSPAHAEIVKAVIDMRHHAGLTQRQLAQRLSREHSFIGRVERGQRRLDLVEFAWICQACETDPEIEVVRVMRAIKHRGTKRPSRPKQL